MTRRPMSGVRVLEVAQFTFVPAAGAVLADWGADVIKVEHAVTGDAQRGFVDRTGWRDGAFHPIMEHPNRGKRSIGLSLENPDALDVLYEIARTSDVFLTNFLPDARARLRIDVDDLRAVNPNIIYVRGSALGVRGDEAREGGYDASVFWARAASAAGATPNELDGLVGMPAPAYGDTMGGMTIAGGIAAALFSRATTGEPSVVDVSLLSVGIWANALAVDISIGRGESWPGGWASQPNPTNPLGGAYRTSDGRYIYFSVMQPGRDWSHFCRAMDREDLIGDERWNTTERLMSNAPAASEIVRAEIASRSLDECVDALATFPGAWAPVQDALEVANDPQVRANGLIGEIADAEGRTRELVCSPVQFDEEPVSLERAPQFAEHTDELLRELGKSEDEIIRLKLTSAVT